MRERQPGIRRNLSAAICAVWCGLWLSLSAPPLQAQTIPTCSPARPCQMTWTPNSESDMQEYRVFLSTTAGAYDLARPTATIPHPNASSTTVNLGTLTDGVYFLAVTAVDQAGNMSARSNEVSFRFDGPPGAPAITITVLVP